MKRLLIALAVIAVANPLFACINTYGTDLKGQAVETFYEGDDLVDSLTKPEGPNWRVQKKKLSRNLSQATIEQQNDYAAALLHLGEIRPALAILVHIEQTKPGLYATATNLGTAYELVGKNEHALSWIRAGIHRNPGSHEGSEWLHVAILETKLAMARNPGWLRTHSVLGLDLGSDALPRMLASFPSGNRGNKLDAQETRQAIHVQMAERLQFVAPPAPIVGDLLFDYANLLMLTDTMENAPPSTSSPSATKPPEPHWRSSDWNRREGSWSAAGSEGLGSFDVALARRSSSTLHPAPDRRASRANSRGDGHDADIGAR